MPRSGRGQRGRSRSRSRSRSPEADDARARARSPPRAAAAAAPPFPLTGFEWSATVVAARALPEGDLETFGGFNIFALHSEADLERAVARILRHGGLAEQLGASAAAVDAFAGRLRSCYTVQRHNAASQAAGPPYHHFVHALDVTQAAFALVTRTEAATALSPLSKLTLLLAALFHDCGHGGRTTPFLRATHDALVNQFGADSSLEHFHWSLCYAALAWERTPGGLLAALDEAQFARMCADARECILATDIARHRAVMAEFAACPDRGPLDGASELPEDSPVRVALLAIMLKSADLSNLARPPALAAAWTELVTEEFHRQGDTEKALGLPVPPSNDRDAPPADPEGFVNAIVRPLFASLTEVLPGARFLLEGIDARPGQ